MRDVETLEALLERVKVASGPDDNLSADIARAFGWYEDDSGFGHHEAWYPPPDWKRPLEHAFRRELGFSAHGYYLPDFTASVDAALALVERVLPGWSHTSGTEEHHENGFRAQIWPSWGADAYRRREGKCGRTQALALLAALLTALIERETT